MNRSEVQAGPDGEFVFVHGARATTLLPFLVPDAPWIWILGHLPVETVRWWTTSIALNERGSVFTGSVRGVEYDLQLPTAEFLAKASEFDAHGLTLVQSASPMPDTLRLDRIPEGQRDRVLIGNGAVLSLWLPHAVETAIVKSFVPGHLAAVLERLDRDAAASGA